MAIGAVELFVLGGERMVNKRHLAVGAFEALLMPVPILVGQILGVGSNRRLAVFAAVGEECFVAFDAERFLVAQNVTVADQIKVAVEAGENRRLWIHRPVVR